MIIRIRALRFLQRILGQRIHDDLDGLVQLEVFYLSELRYRAYGESIALEDDFPSHDSIKSFGGQDL
jgi:hypothetical protein